MHARAEEGGGGADRANKNELTARYAISREDWAFLSRPMTDEMDGAGGPPPASHSEPGNKINPTARCLNFEGKTGHFSRGPWPREKWCGRSESNRHTLRYQILSLARLPVPPRPHESRFCHREWFWVQSRLGKAKCLRIRFFYIRP